MKCPKCEEGSLVKIKFKVSGKCALLCDYCDSLWFDHERVSVNTGHTLRIYFQDKEHEFYELCEDWDHRPVKRVRHV